MSTFYSEPCVGDVWVVEEQFWDREKVAAAKAEQVNVLLLGLDSTLEEDARLLGIDAMLGDSVDPDEILRWVHEKRQERPRLRKAQKRGSIVGFAGLLPTGGGVGKDTLVMNTASWLSVQGKTVAVVDLDPFGTLKDRLKVETTLSVDVWEERFMNIPLTAERVKDALVRVKGLKFWLLPASTERRMQPDAVIRHMGEWLPQAFDITIWNLGSGIANKPFLVALREADHIFLVGMGDRAKFPLYKSTLEDYEETLEVKPRVVFNKFYEKDAPAFFEEEFGYSVFAYALEDRRVFDLNEQGKAAALEQPKRPFGLAVAKIGREILGEREEAKKGGWRLW